MLTLLNNKKFFLILLIVSAVVLFSVFSIKKKSLPDLTVTYFTAYLSRCDFSGMSRDNIYTSKKYEFSFTYPENTVVCELHFSESNQEYGTIAQFHVMKKDLFISTDAAYINDRYAIDSLKIKIRRKSTPDIIKEKIVTDLPLRKINGINARVGIGELSECKNSFCADIRITRLIANEVEYEFIGNQTFDKILDTFSFLSKAN